VQPQTISLSSLSDRPPPRLGDPHPRDLHRLAARDHALGLRGRELGAHKVDYLPPPFEMGFVKPPLMASKRPN